VALLLKNEDPNKINTSKYKIEIDEIDQRKKKNLKINFDAKNEAVI